MEHATSNNRAAGTITRMALSINDDSLFYPSPIKPSDRFSRKRSLYNITDFNRIPGFLQEADTVSIETNIAFHEEGVIVRNEKPKTFYRKKAAGESMLSLGLSKAFPFGLVTSCKYSISRTRSFSEEGVGIPLNVIDKLVRSSFSLPAEFLASNLHNSREIKAAASWFGRNATISLSANMQTVDYNMTKVRDFIAVNLNGVLSF
jgi:hypothetical protein